MTATTEHPTVEDRAPRLQTTVRRLIVAVIVLAMLAMGLGAWATYQASTDSDSAVSENQNAELADAQGALDELAALTPPDDVVALVEEWDIALARGDGSVTELYRPSGYHLYGTKRIDLDGLEAHLSGASNNEAITKPILIVDEGDGRYVVTRGFRNTINGTTYASALTYTVVTGPSGHLKFSYTEWTKVA